MRRMCTCTLLGFGLVVAACGSTTVDVTTTAATPATSIPTTSRPATTMSTSTTAAATTAAPSTTTITTQPPSTTTTTLPAPPPVEGWDGDGVGEVAIDIQFEPALAALDMEGDVEDALEIMGIDEDSDAGALLTFDIEGTPYSDVYGDLGRCYTAARISGSVRLTAPDRIDVSEELSYRLETPFVVFRRNCSDDPDDAPYAPVFQVVLPDALTGIWGPAAVPYLIAALDGEVRDSGWDYPHWAAVMDAFRDLDDRDIADEDTREFLGRAIDALAGLVETGYSPHGLATAAGRVLEAYAGTNYGVASEDDVRQWRDWLEGWEGSS